jgi:hypothetical protein
MRLIDDQRVVLAEQRIGLGLCQQNPIGHQLDGGAGRHVFIESNLVPNVHARG